MKAYFLCAAGQERRRLSARRRPVLKTQQQHRDDVMVALVSGRCARINQHMAKAEYVKVGRISLGSSPVSFAVVIPKR